jgi:hypothetical protein
MNTKKILLLPTIAMIAVGGLFASSFAAENSPATTPLRGQILQRIAARLHLTDDQKAQIKIVLSGEKDTLATLLGRLHDARKGLPTVSCRICGANISRRYLKCSAMRTGSSPPF